MDRRNVLKRSSDREPSEGAKLQRVEGGFASGTAGRRHFLCADTARQAYHQASPSEQLKPRDQVGQTQTTLGEDLSILEQQNYEMYQHIQAMKKKYQAGLNNLVTRDFLAPLHQEQVIQTQRDEARRKQQEVGPNRQGDPSSRSGHLELSIDDFELCSMELRKPHDQTQGLNSQSLAESQQPFAAHHPAEATPVEQRQETLVQQHEGHEQAGPHSLEKLPLPQNQAIDHSKDKSEYEKLIYFLTPEEHENLLSGLSKTHRTPKERLAVKIFHTVKYMNQRFHSKLYIRKVLHKIREENQYKEIYGNEGEKCRSDQEPSKRTWTTQQLHRFVDEMVQIKDFDYRTFQDALSKESKDICEQLNKYGSSFNDQEWEDIKTRFQNHNILDNDKRRKYLRYRTENSRKLQKMREIRADSKSQQQGLKNRHQRLSKKKRLNDASEPS